MTHSPHQNTPDPEDYIPSFRRRNLDTSGFKKKPVKRLTSCLVLNWIQFDYTYINMRRRPSEYSDGLLSL